MVLKKKKHTIKGQEIRVQDNSKCRRVLDDFKIKTPEHYMIED